MKYLFAGIVFLGSVCPASANLFPASIGNTWRFEYHAWYWSPSSYSSSSVGMMRLTIYDIERTADTVFISFADTMFQAVDDNFTAGKAYYADKDSFMVKVVNDEYLLWGIRDVVGSEGDLYSPMTVYFNSLVADTTYPLSDFERFFITRYPDVKEYYINNIGWAGYSFAGGRGPGYAEGSCWLIKAVINDSTYILQNDSLVYTGMNDFNGHHAPGLFNATQYYSLNGIRLPGKPEAGLFIEVMYDAAGNVEIRKVFRN